MKLRSRVAEENGNVLLFVLMAISILTIFAAVLLPVATNSSNAAIARQRKNSARNLAEAGMAKALVLWKSTTVDADHPLNIPDTNMPGGSYTATITALDIGGYSIVANGKLTPFGGKVLTSTITGTAQQSFTQGWSYSAFAGQNIIAQNNPQIQGPTPIHYGGNLVGSFQGGNPAVYQGGVNIGFPKIVKGNNLSQHSETVLNLSTNPLDTDTKRYYTGNLTISGSTALATNTYAVIVAHGDIIVDPGSNLGYDASVKSPVILISETGNITISNTEFFGLIYAAAGNISISSDSNSDKFYAAILAAKDITLNNGIYHFKDNSGWDLSTPLQQALASNVIGSTPSFTSWVESYAIN